MLYKGLFVRKYTLTLIAILPLCAFAQEVTIINNFSGKDGELPLENYVLSKVTQHTYVLNEYEPLQSGQRAQVEQMIRYGLRSYIDNQYFASKGKVVGIDSKESFSATAAAIVSNALWIHDYGFHEDFKSFSKSVVAKAGDLKSMNGFRIDNSSDVPSGPRNGAVDIYTFQRMVYELKASAEKEAGLFLDAHVRTDSNTAANEVEENTHPILPEMEYTLPGKNENIEQLTALKPVQMPRSFKPEKKRRRSSEPDPTFNNQIVKLLEENNKILSNYGSRFNDLQEQINEIRGDRNLTTTVLREEMAALREMMQSFMLNGSRPTPTAVASGALVATLTFEKNAHQLTPGHRAQLNRVEIDLKLDKGLVVLVTGFADRTGNANFNAWISEQRANAAFDYLIERNIHRDRIVVNYLGDIDSRFANPADRKVEVSYVKPVAGN